MAKKKAARGGGTNSGTLDVPAPKAARKKKAKTGDEAPQVQKGIADVLDPRDPELEDAYKRLSKAKAACVKTEDERVAAYDDLKKLMRDKDVATYRLHDEPSRRLVFKSRDAEVKIEKIKKPKKSETANED